MSRAIGRLSAVRGAAQDGRPSATRQHGPWADPGRLAVVGGYPRGVPSEPIPATITELAERRAVARRARDWATADALRDQIEDAGWSIVDAGTLYTLQRSRGEDVTDGPLVRYGSSASVPSRLAEPAAAPASALVIATDWPDDLERSVRGISATAPAGTQLVIVANGPSVEQADRLPALEADHPAAGPMEIVWTRDRLGHAAALNAGIRRATGAVVVLLDTGIEPEVDILGPMVTALDDPTVAVVGPFGLVSDDLRRFEETEPAVTDRDVVAIEGYALGIPARGLRRARPTRRALHLLPQPRHLVEPRSTRPAPR